MGSPGLGARLGCKLALAQPRLDAAAHAFWSRSDLARVLPHYFLDLHAAVRASVPLMETALGRASGLTAQDPTAAPLVDYLARHVDEERDHDRWLLDDLSALGLDRAAVEARVPPPEVARLIGCQYYWVLHAHPLAVLGYLLVIEGQPPEPTELDAIERRTGAPAEAFRTLREHAELDPGHRAELRALLDSLPVSSRLESLLTLSALTTLDALGEVLDRLARVPASAAVAVGA